ncbi:MAG: SIMPL domain-containing protein, partial [Cyanobacteria bacterium P01_A01_bin.83]
NKSLALVELLRSRSVDQLKTTSIALRTYYESGDEKNLIKYVSTNKVSFSVSISDLGFLLDQTVKAGASRIDRVNFVATPEAILLAKQEALRKATIDAKTKAEVVLSTLGFTLEDVVRIEINGNPVSEIRTERRRRSSGGIASGDEDSSGIGISVIGGEQIVDASVTLQISY